MDEEKACWNCGARDACCNIFDDMHPCDFWYTTKKLKNNNNYDITGNTSSYINGDLSGVAMRTPRPPNFFTSALR